ncbi:MAG: cysteine--tRNA ligase [Elusimicrobiota bacterium]|nr:cysteine--tRNA ligase [Elusimicrobiota bacterium]
MDVYLYNTLTKQKEIFKPIKDGFVGVYACGPTVYKYAHIGNMRTYVFEDTLIRIFKYLGYKIEYIMNVTDVGHLVSDADEGDDKMEVSAKEEGKSAHEIADFYTKAFFKDFSDLNCLMPDIICKATEHIDEMIRLIERLEKKGFTYKISDGIYFDTSKFKKYGELAGQKHMEGIKAGARVEFNEEKRAPSDFALWKFSPKDKKRQMEWPSPWGTGFPGWHIECSAMSIKYLGETFDIHCGGIDHVAVHHTNEIAQTEGATGKQFVNYWLHAEFLVGCNNEKMAKSAGNFLTVNTLREKNIDPLSYGYFCSSAQYKKQLEFSWESLRAAEKTLASLRESINRIKENVSCDLTEPNKDTLYYKKFLKAISDNLNIPQALAVLWEVLRDKAILPQEKLSFIKDADKVFGLDLLRECEQVILEDEIMQKIQDRENARKAKDFKKSDEIRKDLLERGIVLEDCPQGTKWKKV